jgi:hypothetical protein
VNTSRAPDQARRLDLGVMPQVRARKPRRAHARIRIHPAHCGRRPSVPMRYGGAKISDDMVRREVEWLEMVAE